MLWMTTLVSLGVQFTSTALLSDVGAGIVQTAEYIRNQPYAPNSFVGDYESAPFMERNGRLFPFQAFAEHAVPAPVVPGGDVTDTGVSLRNFFVLFDKSRRERTLSYEGMAITVDTRVVCTRPAISNVSMSIGPGYAFVSGNASIATAVPGLVQNRTENPFECSFAAFKTEYLSANSYQSQHSISSCSLSDAGKLESGLSSTQDWTVSFLVLNMRGGNKIEGAEKGGFDSWVL